MTTQIDSGYEELVALVAPSLLRIEGDRGSGAATVWAPGLAVTNRHVVQGDHAVSCGRTIDVVGADDELDLCLLSIPEFDLPALEVRLAPLRVGELVVAMGHPLGLTSAITAGIVAGETVDGAKRLIRADLQLAPGNSGGPLVDSRGRLVGINVMVAGGLGLAIPTDEIKSFVERVMAGPKIKRELRLGE